MMVGLGFITAAANGRKAEAILSARLLVWHIPWSPSSNLQNLPAYDIRRMIEDG
jgi:hypothetical protein